MSKQYEVLVMYWTDGQKEEYDTVHVTADNAIDAMAEAENRVLVKHPTSDYTAAVECDELEDRNAAARSVLDQSMAADVAEMNRRD